MHEYIFFGLSTFLYHFQRIFEHVAQRKQQFKKSSAVIRLVSLTIYLFLFLCTVVNVT